MIRILAPGPLALLQDLGRPGFAHLGVPRSGAADLLSHDLANRLVGNDDGEATIELLLGSADFLFESAAQIAVTGAEVSVRVDEREMRLNQVVHVRAGGHLRIGRPFRGVRCYLAVAGGFAVPPVLGSRSSSVLAHLGPAPLQAGDRLPVGTPGLPPPSPDVVRSTVSFEGHLPLRYRRGPRDDWFDAAAVSGFEEEAWTVTSDANRVGVRLAGRPVVPLDHEEMPSEGMVLGAIQVPASGQPIVFLADHPPTGGYPVIGVVDALSVARLAQAAPGTRVHFEPIR
jgi:biotin-dependent carboxylase-like uncharacterized protein